MKKAELLFDSVGYRDEDGATYHAAKDSDEYKEQGYVEVPDKEFDRLKKLGAVREPGKSDASSAGWPGTHDELDKLAADNGVTFSKPDKGLKVSEKQAELEAAGVQPPSE